ncbi:MAG: hypothetical protein AAGB04_00190 [Pseudomonadota bacterium]
MITAAQRNRLYEAVRESRPAKFAHAGEHYRWNDRQKRRENLARIANEVIAERRLRGHALRREVRKRYEAKCGADLMTFLQIAWLIFRVVRKVIEWRRSEGLYVDA